MESYALVEFGKPFKKLERETPTPKDTEVVLKVRCAGVCHSDVHLKHGYFDYGDGRRFDVRDRGMALPMALGHEVYGEVVAAGPNASDAPIGAARLVFPWIGCGVCVDCRDGRENDCLKMRPIGVLRDGGYASHVVVPHPRYLVDIDGLEPTSATPFACSGLTVFSALKKAIPVRDGEWLAIGGAGGLGLMAVSVARAMGIERIVSIDKDQSKLDAATELGAEAAMHIDEGIERLREITGGELRAAVDTVGVEATATLSIEALRKGGRYIIVGLHGGSAKVPLPMLAQKALTVRGSYVGSLGELKELIELVRTGDVAPIPVATRPLADASKTVDDLEAGRIVGRVVLTND